MPIRVAIADDHPVVRRGLAQMVSDQRDMELTAQWSSAAELLAQIDRQAVDVLILDVGLPDASGIDLLPSLRERCPALAVLILSAYSPEQLAARAISAGAAGYLTKESAPEEMIKAIRTVVSGRRYVNQEAADALAAALQLGPNSTQPIDLLSPRERQVVELYASGRTVTEISTEMQLSVRTVSTYKTRVLEKLNLKSNADLIAWAIRSGLVRKGSSQTVAAAS